MDLFEKCYAFTLVDDAIKAGIYPYFPVITTRQDSEVQIDGRSTVMLGSSNYLGLTGDQRIIEAANKALAKFGSGCTGSRILNGTLSLHIDLEKRLAEFCGKEAALTFTTGYQTNLGIISSIAGEQDIMFYDCSNHMSLYDGARLSSGELLEFPHNNMEELERLLSQADPGKGKLIVVDGVYSTEGDLANLPAIVRLKKKYNARLMVDDSHGVGVMGKTGRGVGEYFGLMDEIDIYMGTFSKAFASLGGFIAAEAKVIQYVSSTSRPIIFTAAMPPSNAAVVLEALNVLEAEPERVQRIHENAAYMRKCFKELGIPACKSEAPIIPIMTYSDLRTYFLTKQLLLNGVFVNPIASPAVPVGGSQLRTTYSASHTKDQLDYALEKFDLIFNKLYPMTQEEIELTEAKKAK